MAKATVKAKPAPEPGYDVAISFLVADEKIASAIKTRLAGLNVFFYPHNQRAFGRCSSFSSKRRTVRRTGFRTRIFGVPWVTSPSTSS
jgi:hypothetical protein